jgi:tetratricopeptide (TPR) repeat protein
LLAAGDRTRAAAAFGLALRAAPAAASDVIEALGGGDAEEDPALDLVRADALRLIGRVDEALALYRRSFERLARAADRRPGGPPET